ncbi:MAG: sulfite oxidase heme-binding subunit YedZ [Gemmatimonadaceae bacterium]
MQGPARRRAPAGDGGGSTGSASAERGAGPGRPGGARAPLLARRATPRVPRDEASRARLRSLRRSLEIVAFALSLLPLAYVAWAALADPDRLGANPINAVEHFTGEWALRFLLFTLAVTPARQITGWGELVKYRRMLGLFAFFYATVHLLTWVVVDMELDLGDMGHDIVKHKYVTIGMLGWLMLLPLAVTSTKGWIRRLGGRRWNRLHKLAYAAAVAGTIHFFWAVKKDIGDPLIFAGILAALLAYRGWKAALRRRERELRAVA